MYKRGYAVVQLVGVLCFKPGHRFDFQWGLLRFLTDLILPATLCPWSWFSLKQKWVPGVLPRDGKGSQCVQLTTLPPSCVDCQKTLGVSISQHWCWHDACDLLSYGNDSVIFSYMTGSFGCYCVWVCVAVHMWFIVYVASTLPSFVFVLFMAITVYGSLLQYVCGSLYMWSARCHQLSLSCTVHFWHLASLYP